MLLQEVVSIIESQLVAPFAEGHTVDLVHIGLQCGKCRVEHGKYVVDGDVELEVSSFAHPDIQGEGDVGEIVVGMLRILLLCHLLLAFSFFLHFLLFLGNGYHCWQQLGIFVVPVDKFGGDVGVGQHVADDEGVVEPVFVDDGEGGEEAENEERCVCALHPSDSGFFLDGQVVFHSFECLLVDAVEDVSPETEVTHIEAQGEIEETLCILFPENVADNVESEKSDDACYMEIEHLAVDLDGVDERGERCAHEECLEHAGCDEKQRNDVACWPKYEVADVEDDDGNVVGRNEFSCCSDLVENRVGMDVHVEKTPCGHEQCPDRHGEKNVISFW